jgi:hypothetical protein
MRFLNDFEHRVGHWRFVLHIRLVERKRAARLRSLTFHEEIAPIA